MTTKVDRCINADYWGNRRSIPRNKLRSDVCTRLTLGLNTRSTLSRNSVDLPSDLPLLLGPLRESRTFTLPVDQTLGSWALRVT